MENDADDLRGPFLTCNTCHDTNNYPFFKSGTDGDGDGKYNLSETDVCDNCHSPNGSFDGVNDAVIGAKSNWGSGVYASPTLKTGKEKWCAGCHDDVPAYSKEQHIAIIIDNLDAGYSDNGWSNSTSGQQYGTNFRYRYAGTGTYTATWTPNIPQAGEYSVYAWWVDYTNRATNAPYTINYDGGSEVVIVNQKIRGGTWNYLGTYTFAAGTSGSVTLADDTDGLVVADALKFESGGRATYAPNVIGDNTNYGFYVTGHKMDCLSCHDSEIRHIDGDPRTYDADEATSTAINPYCDSYRLKFLEDDTTCSMNVPRATASNSPITQWQHFALCFDCHNKYEVIGENSADVSNTNFWNDDSSDANSHWLHLAMNSKHVDSDFDTVNDSRESCIACHNVHGSPSGPMIRHGELISPRGTTKFVPAVNFFYLIEGDGSATATFTPSPSLLGGTYDVYAWWSVHANRATNAKFLVNHDGGQDEVVVNQEQNGGQWNLLGQYDIAAGTGSVVLTNEGANQYIMADAIRWYRTDGGDEVIEDDPDAAYAGSWTVSEHYRYGSSYRYHNTGSGTDTATWTPDILSAGTYSVYAWWHAEAANTTSAPYTINYDGGSAPVTKDQEQDGGQWNLLGTYPFAVGTSGNVVLGESSLGRAAADVIGWDSDGVFVDDWNGDGILDPEILLDDPSAVFTGTWTSWTTERYLHSTTYIYAPTKDATADALDSIGGNMNISGSLAGNHVCQMCHSDVQYFRDPLKGPRIPGAQANPNQVPNSQATSVFFTAYVTDPDDNVTGVTADLSPVGGGISEVMYDDGTHGDVTPGDDTYSLQFTVPAGIDEGPKALRVTATDADSNTGEAFISLTVREPGSLIIDNTEATFVDTWPASTGGTGKYGVDYQYHAGSGTGANTATWSFTIDTAGNYEVYAWWVAGSSRASDAPYTINYEGGSDTVRISQRIKGGQWNYLGTYAFGVGTYSVVLSDDVNDLVIADAIKVSPEGSVVQYYPFPISDNPDAEYVGEWLGTERDDKYGDDFYYIAVGSGTNSATWTLAVPEAGNYNVYAWWDEGPNRAADTEYTINYEGGSDTVEVSQQNRGGQWNYLGNYPFNAGNYSVVMTDDATVGDFVIADAIKFELGSPPDAPYPIADNWDAVFVGPWSSYSGSEEYGPDFQHHDAGTGSNTVTWTIKVPSAGDYSVYAWWTAYSNRAKNAPYTINYEGGSDTVYISQQVKGGMWNYLGTYTFNAGNYTVVLTDDADGRVVADAIKFEPGSYTPGSSWPIVDNPDADVIGPWYTGTWLGGGAFYGDDYYVINATNTGDNTITWTLAVPTSGNYNVHTRWTEDASRAADVPYTINYEGGSDTVEVCQEIRGGQWNYLGNYYFDVGDYSVVISDDVTYLTSGDYVIADAVMFESGSAPPNPYPIADNWDATFTGPWEGATWIDGGTPYGPDYQLKYGAAGANTTTWKTDIPAQGTYSIYTRWSEYSNRATDAPYTINYEGGSDLVDVNQTTNGGKWMYLGSYPFNADTYSVVLSDDVPGFKRVIADAVRWEKGVVVDNPDATLSGTWTEATDTTDTFSTNYHYHDAGSGTDTATWTPDIPATGTYAVYAWWSADTDRATDAPYTISYNGGTATVPVDQTADGGKWNYLGTYSFLIGTSGYVELGETSTGKVIADAVRWVPLEGSSSKGSQLVDHIPPDYSATSMTFTGEIYDSAGIGSIQVVGYSSGSSDWAYEDMTTTEGITWTKVLGANDWVVSNGYYFKVIDNSANITFIGCGGEQYSVEGGYGSDALAEAAAQSDTYSYGGGACST